ncbi:hypothetical protein LTR36_009712 [Oleoguttula mirabilis]|uniref:Uncharacterized protein n=1 Tax=Oleoguttula mirabilis TaxID=1507867 RepID=A0AAV9J5Z2_9PEZI|nr:hypothetical protein LTR36_009712 [Oleoguttula mirabilis]
MGYNNTLDHRPQERTERCRRSRTLARAFPRQSSTTNTLIRDIPGQPPIITIRARTFSTIARRMADNDTGGSSTTTDIGPDPPNLSDRANLLFFLSSVRAASQQAHNAIMRATEGKDDLGTALARSAMVANEIFAHPQFERQSAILAHCCLQALRSELAEKQLQLDAAWRRSSCSSTRRSGGHRTLNAG